MLGHGIQSSFWDVLFTLSSHMLCMWNAVYMYFTLYCLKHWSQIPANTCRIDSEVLDIATVCSVKRYVVYKTPIILVYWMVSFCYLRYVICLRMKLNLPPPPLPDHWYEALWITLHKDKDATIKISSQRKIPETTSNLPWWLPLCVYTKKNSTVWNQWTDNFTFQHVIIAVVKMITRSKAC